MANYLISGSFALVSAFVGMFLPMVSTVGPIQRPTIGMVHCRIYRRCKIPTRGTFGSIVWPIVVIQMVTYFLGRQLSAYPDLRFVIVLCCIFLLFLIVPGGWAANTPLKYIPTYSSILLAVY